MQEISSFKNEKYEKGLYSGVDKNWLKKREKNKINAAHKKNKI